MAGLRPPLPLRGLHGPAQPTTADRGGGAAGTDGVIVTNTADRHGEDYIHHPAGRHREQAQTTILGNQCSMPVNGGDSVRVAEIYQQIEDDQNRWTARDAAPVKLYPGCRSGTSQVLRAIQRRQVPVPEVAVVVGESSGPVTVSVDQSGAPVTPAVRSW